MIRINLMIDATRVAPKLWIGSAPLAGTHLRDAGFDTLVLCAEEYQPPAKSFPGVKVIRCPFDDSYLSEEEEQQVAHCARQVLGELRRQRRVLVTCWAGRNRSGLVVARVLMKLSGKSAKEVVKHVQAVRESALTNHYFVKSLNGYAASAAFV